MLSELWEFLGGCAAGGTIGLVEFVKRKRAAAAAAAREKVEQLALEAALTAAEAQAYALTREWERQMARLNQDPLLNRLDERRKEAFEEGRTKARQAYHATKNAAAAAATKARTE